MTSMIDDIIDSVANLIESPVPDKNAQESQQYPYPPNWTTLPVPKNAREGQWMYSVHPPAVTNPDTLFGCPNCRCLVLTLIEPFDLAKFWCVHCGPQTTLDGIYR